MTNAIEVSPALFSSLKITAPSYAGGVSCLDTAAAAKLIRHLLKAAFPAVKFSVRTSRYAGGSSIDISWQDGPSHGRVDALVSQIEGKGFDGMQDLEYTKAPFLLNGTPVRAYCYIRCTRHISDRLRERAAQQVAAYYGCALPPADQRGRQLSPDGYHDWSTLIYRACEDRTRFSLSVEA